MDNRIPRVAYVRSRGKFSEWEPWFGEPAFLCLRGGTWYVAGRDDAELPGTSVLFGSCADGAFHAREALFADGRDLRRRASSTRRRVAVSLAFEAGCDLVTRYRSEPERGGDALLIDPSARWSQRLTVLRNSTEAERFDKAMSEIAASGVKGADVTVSMVQERMRARRETASRLLRAWRLGRGYPARALLSERVEDLERRVAALEKAMLDKSA